MDVGNRASLCILSVALCLGAELHGWTIFFLLLFGIANLFSRSITEFSLLPAMSHGMKEGRSQKFYWTAVNFGYFIGPAIAGAVLAMKATDLFFWLYALAGVLAALAFFRMEIVWPSNRSTRMRLDGLQEGFRVFRGLSALRKLTLVLFLYNLGVGALPTVIVFSLLNEFGVSAGTVGYLTSLMALSSVVGSLMADQKLPGRRVAFGVGFWLLGTAASLLFLNSTVLAVFLPACLVLHMFEGGMNVQTMILRTRIVPQSYQGRVNGIVRSIVVSAIPLSAALLGAISQYGEGLAYPVAVAFAGAAGLIWQMAGRGALHALAGEGS